MDISSRLILINTIRDDIIRAIEEKGASVSSFSIAAEILKSLDIDDSEAQKALSALVAKELGSILNTRATKVGYHVGTNNTALKKAECSAVTQIDRYAFEYSGLEEAIFPAVESKIGSYAFQCCSKLKNIDFPNLKYIEPFASTTGSETVSTYESDQFRICAALESVSFPEFIGLKSGQNSSNGKSMFDSCAALKNVSMPKMEVVPDSMFYEANLSGDLDFSSVKTIGNSSFRKSKIPALTEKEFPVVEYIGDYAFMQATSISIVNLPYCKTLGTSAIRAIHSFSDCILPVCTSIGWECFWNNRIKNLYAPELITVKKTGLADNYGLVDLSLPKLKVAEDQAFQQLRDLKNVSLPSLTTIGERCFSECLSLEEISLPSVTTISDSAFSYCGILKKVDFPAATTIEDHAFYKDPLIGDEHNFPNVTKIGSYVFSDNTAMTTVNFPAVKEIASYAFKNGTEITTLQLPLVERIEIYAFDGCNALKEIHLPSIIYLGGFSNCTLLDTVDAPNCQYLSSNEAFKGCSSLAELDLPSLTQVSGDNVINGTKITELAFPELTQITSDSAFSGAPLVSADLPKCKRVAGFSGCTTLTTVNMPSVNYIGSSAFKNCYNVESFKNLDLPLVTEVQKDAFRDCTQIETVNLPLVERPYDGSFCNCTNLTSVRAPKMVSLWNRTFANTGIEHITAEFFPSVTWATDATFIGNTKLKTAVLPALKTYQTEMFMNCPVLESVSLPSATEIETRTFANCVKLKEVNAPKASTINPDAFLNCSSLESISLPSASSISSSFKNCTSLKTLNLPLLKSISGSEAFSGCTSLETLTLPSLNYISGERTFVNCTSLKSMDFSSESINYIGSNSNGSGTFYGCENLEKVWIPASCKTIHGTTKTNFHSTVLNFGLCLKCIVYTDATSQPTGWKDGWNYLELGNSSDTVPVVYGATKEDFENDVARNSHHHTVTFNILTEDATLTVSYLGYSIENPESLSVLKGRSILYSVSKDGYDSIEGTWTAEADETLSIELEASAV